MPAYKLVSTESARGPKHWACYFINGDASGMTDEEIRAADAWLEFHCDRSLKRHASIVDCTDDSDDIGMFNGLLTDLTTYTYLVYEEKA